MKLVVRENPVVAEPGRETRWTIFPWCSWILLLEDSNERKKNKKMEKCWEKIHCAHWLEVKKEVSIPDNARKFTNSMKFDLGCKYTPLANTTIPIYKNNNNGKK